MFSITVLWKLKAPNQSSFGHRGLNLNAKLIYEPIQGSSRKRPLLETRLTSISNAGVDMSPRTCFSSCPSGQVMEFRGERSSFQSYM